MADDEKAIDDESLQFLEQVRKGKMRNFVMSVKGAKVQSLLVKKKKLKDKEIKEARGGGFQPMYGVVEGQGNNLTFKIAKSDGFEKDPLGGKVAKLKEFLKNQTGKAYKPTVEVVDTTPPIPFDEEDLKNPLIARFMSLTELIQQVITQHPDAEPPVMTLVNDVRVLLGDDETIGNAEPKIVELENLLHTYEVDQNAAPSPQEQTPPEQEPSQQEQAPLEQAPPEQAPPEQAPTDSQQEPQQQDQAPPQRSALADKLAEGLKKLKPAVQEAIQIAPDQKQVLLTSMGQVVSDIKSENLDEAKVNMVALGKLIQEIRGQGTPKPEKSTDEKQPENPNAQLAAKLGDALKKLKPAADKIITSMPDKKAELYEAIAKIAGEIKGGQFDIAKQSIAEFAPLLKQLQLEATGSTADPQQDQMAQFRLRRQQIEPGLLEAGKKDFERKSELQMIWDASDEKAKQGDFDAANKMLERLEGKIGEILAATTTGGNTGIEPGLVEKRKFLVTRFQQIPVEIKPHLDSVKKSIIDENADDDPSELISAIENALQEFFDEIQDEIDQSINSGDSSQIAGLKNRVTSNPLVQHMISNPFTDGTQFQSAILNALTEIEQKLAG